MNKKANILRLIFTVLLFFMFVLIFDFSDQDGEESGNLSRTVTEVVTEKISAVQQLDEEKKESLLDIIEAVIRKIAHFSLYTFVGGFAISLLNTYNLEVKKRVQFSFLIGLLYAILDEFHQYFIPDRNAAVTDVLIDSCGVIFGIVIGYLMYILIKKKILKNS